MPHNVTFSVMNPLPTTTDYHQHFDSEWFIQNYVDNMFDEKNSKGANVMKFCLQKFKEIFSEGMVRGSRLLDVGTGPSIHSVISASDYVQDIYLSDFTESNLQILNDWLLHKRDLDNTSFLYLFSEDLPMTAISEKKDRIRGQVKAVVPINISSNRPLELDHDLNEFDVITSKLCLECASHTLGEYRNCVKNMVSLLRYGGFTVVAGVLNEKYYKIGNFRFAVNCVNKDDVMKAFEDAGIEIFKFVEHENVDSSEYTDYKSVFVMAGQKRKYLC